MDFVNGGGRGAGRKALKLLMVDIKAIFSVFFHISITIRPKMNRERSKRGKIEKI